MRLQWSLRTYILFQRRASPFIELVNWELGNHVRQLLDLQFELFLLFKLPFVIEEVVGFDDWLPQ